jgi:hypothetical protein
MEATIRRTPMDKSNLVKLKSVYYARSKEVVERRQKFFEWLRDPANKQVQGTLCIIVASEGNDPIPQYCCLGGACEVSGLGKWVEPLYEEVPPVELNLKTYVKTYAIGADTAFEARYNHGSNAVGTGILPGQVADYYEFQYGSRWTNPKLALDTRENKEISASELNDAYDLTFAEIADYFESVFPAEMDPIKETTE